ncbi:hypothetical protein C482_17388 [Natrialba chahannaoensis JCM 10990]|uniref:Uncharacterized protein n=1 Tax=Natrialba chahannaoensis JCM 10990 TaxID=1227492 RepID=M0A921_9EURY|nr:hypothetical protein [Natrialba chahannaoensis]ELY94871.1 hypothetical protein C482_17388 [Natrialba chahannaoensis JCM 10990]
MSQSQPPASDTAAPLLTGTLHVLPFGGGSLAARVARIYSSTLEHEPVDGDPRNVLVLKRLPTAIDEFAASLRDEVGLEGRPNVKSLPRHATAVVEEAEPELTRLSYEERIEFLARVLDGYDWSSYFERASEHDSFGRDVGQLLLDATWNGGFGVDVDADTDTDADADLGADGAVDTESDETSESDGSATDDDHDYDDYLRELADVNASFHDHLAERNLAEQAQTIERAIAALEREAIRERIEREFDAVLVVEYEECGDLDREYLRALTRNVDLICVAEEHASIERTKTEVGSVRRFADGLEIVDHTADGAQKGETDAILGVVSDGGTAATQPDTVSEPGRVGQPFGAFLATGRPTRRGENGELAETEGHASATAARVISEPTLDQQVETVANEIEYLRQKQGLEYEDVAVLLRSIGNPAPRVRRVLQHAGVPTASAGVNGLEQDLAVRELHALAQYHIDDRERAYDLLAARVPDLTEDLVQRCVVRNSVSKSLKRWIVTTDLKRRIAEDADPIDAREQFRNVSRLLSIAEFVDEQDILAGDWIQFVTMLERAITYDAPYAHTAEVAVPEGGVTVGDVGLVKHDSRRAVFLLNVVDGEYPGSEPLSPLFPTAWIKRMDGYPAVTNPSPEAVAETYATVNVEEITDNAFERYHAERTRRQLAIGARAAEEYLYFCTYRQTDGSVGRLQHRSRYLHAIDEHPHPALSLADLGGGGADGCEGESDGDGDGENETIPSRDLYTLGSASAEILSQPWNALETVQAEASTGGEVALESTEKTLAAIQRVLEESEDVDPRFERAVETQFDLARGAIRPESGEVGESSESGGGSGSDRSERVDGGGRRDDDRLGGNDGGETR